MRHQRRDTPSLKRKAVSFSVNAEHLYIHVPFCARRCVYCDFSIAVRTRVPVEDYITAVAREWDQRHAASRFTLRTLYVGGGTPSKLGADGVQKLLDVVRARAPLDSEAEVTIEANPEDVTVEVVRAWREAGVNRISLGVQSFDDAVLKWMHRTHDPATAVRAVESARVGGIDNISIDLIFATPSVPARSWANDIERAIQLDVPHVSAYGLTVEPRTPLGRWVARHEVGEPAEDVFEENFLRAHASFSAAGFEHYEVSNYGRPGRHSRHNWAYWRRQPYGGLGPSAHEFDGETRSWNVEAYARWMSRVVAGASSVEDSERLTPNQIMAECTYLGLRTKGGLALSSEECEHIQPWIASRWATVSERQLRLTAEGWLRLDALAADLTHFRSRY